MTKLRQLAELGQSVWLDYISRSLFTSGELQRRIDQGVRGVTSNPTIFDKAIADNSHYAADLRRLVGQGQSVEDIYEALALDDIGRAADLLRPVYEDTDGLDGYVSLEVSPALAHDTQATIAEARRLFARLERPNVMIKVPATPAGVPAIQSLIGAGVNVNVTLIFSLAHYQAVAEAYIAGLEQRLAEGGALGRIASVASFFVSRLDTILDPLLEAAGAAELQGQIAIANSKAAYTCFCTIFSGPRWDRLAALGARVQRPLWASTGTKNPRYSDTLYMDGLIGPHTVNTAPPATLDAFLDHGQVALTLEAGVSEAHAQLARLAKLGVDLEAVTQKLQDDGVAAFAASFASLLTSIAAQRARLLAGAVRAGMAAANLETYQARLESALDEMEEQQVMARIWAHDHTLWKPDPTEITNRMGWLRIAKAMARDLQPLYELVNDVRAAGYTHALLLGMGGSSLAPEVFRKTFGVAPGYLDLAILDSTDPGAVLAHTDRLDPARSLFIVSTKSGGTVETFSFFKYFYNWVADTLGVERAGEHFVAITDPGSGLAEAAARYHFRATLLNDPNIGGRYSALSYFGLAAAALLGLDIPRLLERAITMAAAHDARVPVRANPGAWLGVLLGELAGAGRDKLTFVVSPAIASFGDWVEQLIAESTGKEGKGILPVVGEPPGPPDVHGADRLFVTLRLEGDTTYAAAVQALQQAGQPVLRLELGDIYDLGGQFFLWEMATAVASWRLGVNPFDQPDVEAAKKLARHMVAAYQEQGALLAGQPALLSAAALHQFLAGAQPGAYIALHAYLQPTPETEAALQALRLHLRDRYGLAVTLGYGPRFLHSTGQLHKGDAGHGLFVQLTADAAQDVPIPDQAGAPGSSISFGVLKMAQALGDGQALREAGRRVIHFHLGSDVLGGLRRLMD
jgi:transaldolase/glucose-6-phosphate isomerase